LLPSARKPGPLRHTLLFNASILGFAIDVTAGLIGGN
jgi:hypothetical protein